MNKRIARNPSDLTFDIGISTLARTETLAGFLQVRAPVLGHFALRRITATFDEEADILKSVMCIDAIEQTHADLRSSSGYRYTPSDYMERIYTRYSYRRHQYRFNDTQGPAEDVPAFLSYTEKLPVTAAVEVSLMLAGRTRNQLEQFANFHCHNTQVLAYVGLIAALDHLEHRLNTGEQFGDIKNDIAHF